MKVKRKQCKVIAIVPAAGMSKRFGSGSNKPFLTLMGKPLIMWSLEALGTVSHIVEIIPVLKIEDVEKGEMIFEEYKCTKIKKIAPGGRERQDSVYNGIRLVKDMNCIILVHDGVRPLVRKSFIEEMIQQMSGSLQEKDRCDGIVPAVPLSDTIKEVKSDSIVKTLRRESLMAIQTPQVFAAGSIFSAYERAMKEGFYSTDDAAIIEHYGGKLRVIRGLYSNIKITTPADLVIAECLLSKVGIQR